MYGGIGSTRVANNDIDTGVEDDINDLDLSCLTGSLLDEIDQEISNRTGNASFASNRETNVDDNNHYSMLHGSDSPRSAETDSDHENCVVVTGSYGDVLINLDEGGESSLIETPAAQRCLGGYLALSGTITLLFTALAATCMATDNSNSSSDFSAFCAGSTSILEVTNDTSYARTGILISLMSLLGMSSIFSAAYALLPSNTSCCDESGSQSSSRSNSITVRSEPTVVNINNVSEDEKRPLLR